MCSLEIEPSPQLSGVVVLQYNLAEDRLPLPLRLHLQVHSEDVFQPVVDEKVFTLKMAHFSINDKAFQI
jgi:hypothetical protein